MCCRTNCSLMSSLINLPIYKRTRAKNVGMTPCQRLFGLILFRVGKCRKVPYCKVFRLICTDTEWGIRKLFYLFEQIARNQLTSNIVRGFESLHLRHVRRTLLHFVSADGENSISVASFFLSKLRPLCWVAVLFLGGIACPSSFQNRNRFARLRFCFL